MAERFGRLVQMDERDQRFLMTRLLPGRTLPASKSWRINPTALDQGFTGTCVGHGWRNFLRCEPRRTERSGPSPWDIYRGAVLLDTWPGNDDEARMADGAPGMDFGTSVRAGAKALAKAGLLASYVWSFRLQPAVEWVLTRGPVVLGTDWYDSFMAPDSNGVVTIRPGAGVVGGHWYLWRGVNVRTAMAKCVNSWGDGWGKSGEFFIPLRDLERLIHDGGEVCSAVEQPLAAA